MVGWRTKKEDSQVGHPEPLLEVTVIVGYLIIKG